MKKLRDRLNKKGFTLVELIVVIVIILILAAALIPNVMRYISEARMASFKSDASSYLVELQASAAEYYAKNDVDIAESNKAAALTLSDFTITNLTVNNAVATGAALNQPTTLPADFTKLVTTGTKLITTNIYRGAVTNFAYTNGRYNIKWGQANGWSDVDKNVATP